MSETIRIYLVDDHRVVRAGLRSILAEYPRMKVVGENGDASAALTEIAQLRPDLVLLDVRLGQDDGCELCTKLKRLSSPPRVLMLTSYVDEELFLRALTNGADGYILKDSRDEALAAAITTVFEGGTAWGSFATQMVKARMGTEVPPINPNELGRLTATERRILALIADGQTNKEIAAKLKFTEKSVRNQVSVLMAKLGVERRVQAAAFFVRSSVAHE